MPRAPRHSPAAATNSSPSVAEPDGSPLGISPATAEILTRLAVPGAAISPEGLQDVQTTSTSSAVCEERLRVSRPQSHWNEG
jgi:hypothetical protein